MKVITLTPYSNYTYSQEALVKLTYEPYAVLPPTLSYLVFDDGQAALINAAAETSEVMQKLEENHLKLTHILITNGHFEHVYFLKEVIQKTGADVYIHEDESVHLESYRQDIQNIIGLKAPEGYDGVFHHISDGDELAVGNLLFKVIHTPGVTPGSVIYQIENTLFTGDFLAHQAVGICDLPKSDSGKLLNSLYKLLEQSSDYDILPSHWGRTTLQHERETNLKTLPNARIIRTVEI